jgi:hypothetical protein
MYFGHVSLLRLPAAKILFENDVDLNELFSSRKLGVRKLDVELAVVLKIGKFLSLMIWIVMQVLAPWMSMTTRTATATR